MKRVKGEFNIRMVDCWEAPYPKIILLPRRKLEILWVCGTPPIILYSNEQFFQDLWQNVTFHI